MPDELYRVKPEEFTALRTRLADQARKRGDADAAKRISASRKPTTAAWVVNRLAISDPAAKQRLAELGEQLRAAHAAMNGEESRELSARQRALIRELAGEAFDRADLKNPPAALRDDVTDTLQAAIADPDVAQQLGRLAKAERYSGFGGFADTTAAFTVPKTVQKDRARDEARATLVAAEKAKAEADDALSERHARLEEARGRHDTARTALRAAERELHAAEEAYDDARRACTTAAARVKEANARLKQAR